MLCLREPSRNRRICEDGQARRVRGLGSAQLRGMAHRHRREGRKRVAPSANRLHFLFQDGSHRFRVPATVPATFCPRGLDPNISGGRRRGQCTKSMIQTHARTHATDLNGVGVTDTEFRRVFGILQFCFITMKKSYIRHHRIFWHTFYFSPPTLEPPKRFGTTQSASVALCHLVSLWISPSLWADPPGVVARGKPRSFFPLSPFWRQERHIGIW